MFFKFWYIIIGGMVLYNCLTMDTEKLASDFEKAKQ